MAKHIFVTGGVASSLGKGLTASSLGRLLKARGLRVVTDYGADKLGAKIRNARLMRCPYIAVVGDKEAAADSVAPRSRDGELGAMPVDAFIERVLAEAALPTLGASAENAD